MPACISAGAAVVGAGTSIYSATKSSNTASTPNLGNTVQSLVQAGLNTASSQLATAQQTMPEYSSLSGNDLYSSLIGNQVNPGLMGGMQEATPEMGTVQANANAQQAAGQINQLGTYGSGMVNSYQNANPQLQTLQNQFTNMALNPQNPVSQIQGAGSWGSGYSQQVSDTVSGNQVANQNVGANAVNAGRNGTVQQLNNTAQQQLALGTSMSPQQTQTVANQVLSSYNGMGRANDPTAIAGLATGLDTYGQQLLNQREANAATAGNLQAGQQQLGLTAQQSNQSAGLAAQQSNQAANLAAQQSNQTAAMQGLGLNYQGLSASGQQALTAAQANQGAQLSNAGYQYGLMGSAANLAQSTAAPAMNALLSPSTAPSQVSTLTNQGLQQENNTNTLATLYNPLQSQLMNTLISSGTQTSLANQNASQQSTAGGLSLLGSGISGLANNGGIGSLFGLGGSNVQYGSSGLNSGNFSGASPIVSSGTGSSGGCMN